MRGRFLVWLCAAVLAACSSDTATGPDSIIGHTFQLASINGGALPVQYYAEAGDFRAVAYGGNITFLNNWRVRAAAHIRVYHDSPFLPDEELTTFDSVPYRTVGPYLLIERPHGWDTAMVNSGLRVRWTTGAGSMGEWLYLRP